jgi:hypothetical protein
MLVAHSTYAPTYRPLGAETRTTIDTRTALIAGGSFLLGVLWGWFGAQA